MNVHHSAAELSFCYSSGFLKFFFLSFFTLLPSKTFLFLMSGLLILFFLSGLFFFFYSFYSGLLFSDLLFSLSLFSSFKAFVFLLFNKVVEFLLFLLKQHLLLRKLLLLFNSHFLGRFFCKGGHYIQYLILVLLCFEKLKLCQFQTAEIRIFLFFIEEISHFFICGSMAQFGFLCQKLCFHIIQCFFPAELFRFLLCFYSFKSFFLSFLRGHRCLFLRFNHLLLFCPALKLSEPDFFSFFSGFLRIHSGSVDDCLLGGNNFFSFLKIRTSGSSSA